MQSKVGQKTFDNGARSQFATKAPLPPGGTAPNLRTANKWRTMLGNFRKQYRRRVKDVRLQKTDIFMLLLLTFISFIMPFAAEKNTFGAEKMGTAEPGTDGKMLREKPADEKIFAQLSAQVEKGRNFPYQLAANIEKRGLEKFPNNDHQYREEKRERKKEEIFKDKNISWSKFLAKTGESFLKETSAFAAGGKFSLADLNRLPIVIFGLPVSGPGKNLLDVPLISQYPELPSGCEVTALAMALRYYGVKVDKTTLAEQMPYDRTPLKRDHNRRIVQWGDPEVGYVGNPYKLGTTINPNPLKKVLDRYRPGGIPLYGKEFSTIEHYVKKGKPVIVWYTLHYRMPEKRTWRTPAGKLIYAPTPLHCVLVTGVSDRHVYFHDSDAGKKHVKVAKDQFIAVYNAMGRRALVVN